MQARQLFIIGAPRSGTTFFTTFINRHPQIFVTNELRAWNIINIIRRHIDNVGEVLPEHPLREAYAKSLIDSFVKNFDDFYLDNISKTNLGCPTLGNQHYFRRIRYYGDKNPDYADANNTGCLDFMYDLMPSAKFVHVHRDPRSCVASYLRVSVYTNDVKEAANIWKRHVSTALQFERENEDNLIRVKYEDLVSDSYRNCLSAINSFLDIDQTDHLEKFLLNEQVSRVPYRSPTTSASELGKTVYAKYLDGDQISIIENECAEYMQELGYISSP